MSSTEPGQVAESEAPEATESVDRTLDPPTAEGVISEVDVPDHAVDAVLGAAIELARAAAVEVGGDSVGDHLRATAEGENLVAHAFAATLPGYAGWYWAVTVARAPRSRTATVDEVVLLPGADALLAPQWVPWQDRLRPGDLSPGDLLPPVENDPRLVPAYVLSDDPAVEEVAFELGIGRVHVLSRGGRQDAAERWFDGEFGPDTPMARQAPGRCGTCGFLARLEGSLRAGFGVCCNEITTADGRVVSVEYGCGAHSDVVAVQSYTGQDMPVFDDGELIVELIARPEPAVSVEPEPSEDSEPEPSEDSEPEPSEDSDA